MGSAGAAEKLVSMVMRTVLDLGKGSGWVRGGFCGSLARSSRCRGRRVKGILLAAVIRKAAHRLSVLGPDNIVLVTMGEKYFGD